MNIVWVIVKKELSSYFLGPIAPVFLSVFWIFTGWYFLKFLFVDGSAHMRVMFEAMPWILMCILPSFSMRIWSEEIRSGTLPFIMTFPIRDSQLIAGKFLAGAGIVIFSILGTLPLAAIVTALGEPDIGGIVMGYLGTICLGLAYLSVGMLMSLLTRNQIVAFILTVMLCFIGNTLSNGILLDALPTVITPLLMTMSFMHHYVSMLRGVLDIRDILYFISVIIFFLYLNLQVMGLRRN
ncbi:MAG: ABC transporter permease subunit [Candidatus Margulisbacteria bacterium]|nr:ABC transporter permease subunit [Candidatus Margulisiibacteriota bacterium]